MTNDHQKLLNIIQKKKNWNYVKAKDLIIAFFLNNRP